MQEIDVNFRKTTHIGGEIRKGEISQDGLCAREEFAIEVIGLLQGGESRIHARAINVGLLFPTRKKCTESTSEVWLTQGD